MYLPSIQNLVLKPLTFSGTLVVDFILLTIILAILYTLSYLAPSIRKRIHRKKASKKQEQPVRSGYMSKILIALATLTLMTGLFPFDSVARTPLYFILQAALAGLTTYLCAARRVKQSTLIYVAIVALVSIPALVYSKNSFYPIYDVKKEPLYITGSITSYMESSAKGKFYYFIPVDPMIFVSLSYMCGVEVSPLIPVFRDVTFYLAIALFMFAIMKKLGRPELFPALLAFMVIPSLSFQSRILSIPYAVSILYLVILAFRDGINSKVMLAYLLTAVVMIFAHPIGPIALLTVFSVLLAWYSLTNSLKTSSVKQKKYTLTKIFSLNLYLITLLYWFLTYIYTLLFQKGVNIALSVNTFISIILGVSEKLQVEDMLFGRTISKFQAPGYSNPDFYVYAYAWAIPLSFSFTLVAAELVKTLLKKNDKRDKTSIIRELYIASSVSALLTIIVAYIGYVMRIESGQYLIPTGYFLASLSLGAVTYTLSKRKNKLIMAIIAIIMALAVGLGTHSPDWAPLEHPNFEVAAKLHPYQDIAQSILLDNVINQEAYRKIYFDYDIPIKSIQYKSIREILYRFIVKEELSLNPYKNSLFVFKKQRLGIGKVAELATTQSLVYVSDTHSAISIDN